MISSDKNILKNGSPSAKRMTEYGKLADIYIILFCLKDKKAAVSKISGNVFVFPTRSMNKLFYFFDGYKIGKEILRSEYKNDKWIITPQDPFEMGFLGFILSRKFKTSLYLQAHTDFLSPYFKAESFLNRARVKMAKFLIPKADGIRIVSKRIKNSLIKEFKINKDKISILPIFVDIKKIKNIPITINLRDKYPQFDFIILIVSRLAKEKNISLALNTMKEIVLKKPKTGLIIAGGGSERKNIENEIKKLNIGENVILEGNIEFNDLISYYKTADIFVSVSNYEGYGMAVLEAMAAGLPVVMTDTGLAGEILINKKDGFVVPVGDLKQLTESILNLMEKKELRARFSKNAQITVNFQQSKEDYFSAYRSSLFNLLSSKK